MKKLLLLFVGILSMTTFYAQNINDALRYSPGEIMGSARYRSLSGAFGALGGDISAISANPASSAIFTNSYASMSLATESIDNKTSYIGRTNTALESDISLNQGGGVFVFRNRNENSPWRKFSLGIAFDNTKNYEDNWVSNGVNGTNSSNGNSIGDYFFNLSQGLRLDEISALSGESTSDAYANIGSTYGYINQQAYLGFDSFILEPDSVEDDNTTYSSNIGAGIFNQEFSYTATGYNGKIAFNAGAQYGENAYFGLNLNSHFLNYDRSTFLDETNNNFSSIVNEVGFENNTSVFGSGFSFQLGGIFKLSKAFRLGLTYDSPTWMTIQEETSQYLETVRQESGENILQIVNPEIVNLFPEYRLKSPSKVTGSLAYIFGKNGLISFDYSRKDFSKTKFKSNFDADFSSENTVISDQLTAAASYKIGGEYKFNLFSFRGGYRFEESPYKNGTTIGDLNGYSLGLGYNFGSTKLDLTFDQSQQVSDYQLYNTGLTNVTTIDAIRSNVTLSLGFQL